MKAVMSSSSSPSMTHGQQLRRSRHHLLSLDCRCRISHSCWHLALEKAANLISSSASAARSLQISNSRRQPLSRFSSSAYTSTRRYVGCYRGSFCVGKQHRGSVFAVRRTRPDRASH
ncbi:Os09g0565850 [Oryza sativa Japonica Group]|uniref:Os09g0565850 protein n=1 Tax=Oryza sativa subsp. japonica TaxID=39947 RepID=A0A0P0XR55_ORYSJ|nr:Os09g0565850 [Oryza sativa Japonica Group]